MNAHCTHREILLNQTKIRLYIPYSYWFGTKQASIWFQINGKYNLISVWFNAIFLRVHTLMCVSTEPQTECALRDLTPRYIGTLRTRAIAYYLRQHSFCMAMVKFSYWNPYIYVCTSKYNLLLTWKQCISYYLQQHIFWWSTFDIEMLIYMYVHLEITCF